MGTYTEPVDSLRRIGKLEFNTDIEGIDYTKDFGLSSENIPDLIRLAKDEDFIEDDADDLDFAATIYALAALTQMRAEEALEPLLPLYKQDTSNEWGMMTLLQFYVNVGPKALPFLAPVLLDGTVSSSGRSYATETIEGIGKKYPETRLECIQALIPVLNTDTSDADLNGSVVSSLAKLKAIEALPEVEKAFQEDRVDLFMAGDWDWDDFQILVGAKEPTEDQRRRLFPQDGDFASLDSLLKNINLPGQSEQIERQKVTIASDNSLYAPPKMHKTVQKWKNKTKMVKISRKNNRKKK